MSAFSVTLLAVFAIAPPSPAQIGMLADSPAPQFRELADGFWTSFPSSVGTLLVGDRGVLVRGRGVERSLSLSLPGSWALFDHTPSEARFRVISADGVRAQPAAQGLLFKSARGDAALRVRFESRGSLKLDWFAESAAALAGVRFQVSADDVDLLGAENHQADVGLETWPETGWLRKVGPDLGAGTPLGGAALPPPQFTQQLVFGSFLGGSGGDEVRAMKLTPSGQLILAGTTWSPDFPVQPGAFDPDPDVGLENTDAFVAGLSADGATLEFATFYGGSGLDSAFALEVDAEGNLLISGGSGSTDLPTTTEAFDRTYNGGPFDGFVARLSADGSALLHASYLGGSGLGSESITSMQLDPLDGSVVVSGPTSSSDWPTTPGSFSEGWLGSSSVFLSRFAPDLTELTASTYFGTGSPAAVRLLADGSALQSGTTSSAANLTITQVGSGAFAHADPPAGPGGGSYLGRLSADFSTMLWSTWTEASFAAVPRDDGSIVLVGATREDDFPTTPGAYSSTFTGQPGVDREHVACAITADGQQLLWATYITSESLVTSAVEAAVDDAGRIYFVSAFSGGSYPFTENAWDTELVGLSEGLLTVLDPVGSQLLYASLLGVGHGSQEVNFRLELDGCGGAYVSGDTFNREFPTTPGALDETYNGAGDAFLVRVNAISPWTNLGGWVGGVQGRPVLTPSGPLCSGDPTSLDITDGPSGGTALLVLGFSQLGAPFKAGVLLPAPDLVSALPLDVDGSGSLDFTWPDGSHSGSRLWLQAWLPDAAGPAGYSATNGVLAEVP